MLLSDALRLEAAPRLALVGAGGKTTALFQLARELVRGPNRVVSPLALVACSTHLGLEQARLADFHFTLHEAGELDPIVETLPSGVVLFTGVESSDERWSGLVPADLERIYILAERRQIPLLIEADGSRMKPVKAPAPHEPVIPPFVDTVVVAAGLSALGQPLTTEWVHRPEIFANLSGLIPGEEITPGALVRVLTHQQGGLKDIPAGARRMVLLNQADTPELQAVAGSMADALLVDYASVIIAALNPSVISITSQVTPPASLLPTAYGLATNRSQIAELRRFTPHPSSIIAVRERVAGIILAAGEARRFGQPKALLDWRGQSFLRHVIDAATGASLSPVIIVTGAYASQIDQACAGLNVKLVHNPDWSEGQSTSLKRGLRALDNEAGAAIFLLADQPQVSAGLIEALVEAHAASLPAVVAPMVDGQRANPTLFDRRTFPELMSLYGDVGGRALFSKYPITWVPWHDPSLLLDVDTPEDYQKLLEIDRDTP